MATRHPHRGSPSPLHSFSEPRALIEMALLPYSLPMLASAPRGDGHPVLLLPGFMGDEATLVALELYLRNRGYDVHAWGLGRNLGFHQRHAQALEKKIRDMHHRNGRKVSLVGWSLGGVFALHGAHQAQECVRMLVTMGSPLSIDGHGSRSPPMVRALYRLMAHPVGPESPVMQPRASKPREGVLPSLPISCLYSLSDGVVPPQEATIDGDPALHENVRVPGSHSGLGFNAVVLSVVADRLAQPEGAWQPFRPSGLAGSVYRMLIAAAGGPAPVRP